MRRRVRPRVPHERKRLGVFEGTEVKVAEGGAAAGSGGPKG